MTSSQIDAHKADNLAIFERLTPEAQAAALAGIAANRTGVNGHGLETAVFGSLQPVPMSELLARQFPPLIFLLDGILAKGHFAMLGGRPKSGKSWLLLQLAQAIDGGIEFLGKQTRRGRVLYIALEDGERRIQQRANTLKWQPKHVDLLFSVANFDGDGVPGPGLAQVEALASNYDLIIVDTLVATFSGRVNENDNVQMALIVNELARIAHASETAIIVSHHTGKGNAEDVFSLLRGASALRGGYDVGLLLERKQGEREAVLHIESRDVDQDSLTIRQASNGAGWECLGGGLEIESIRVGRQIVRLLADLGEGLTARELAEAGGKSEQTIRQQLLAAERRGLVVQATEPNKKGKPAARWWLTKAAGGADVPESFYRQSLSDD